MDEPPCIHGWDTKAHGAVRLSSARAQSPPGLRPPVSSQKATDWSNPLYAEEPSFQWEAGRFTENTWLGVQRIHSLGSRSEHDKAD